MRRLIRWVLILAVLAGGYYWLVLDSRMPAEAGFPLDIVELRRLAGSVPGPRPRELRYERVYTTRFTAGMAVAGDGWAWTEIPIFSYQVLYPDRSVIIDTAMASSVYMPDFLMLDYDEQAWTHVLAAMDKASLILITHEHMDHIGGIAAHPGLERILPNVRLTDAQLAHPDRMWPVKLPAGVFDDYQPLRYGQYHAIAPGMVLIKSPGHTPGSQMVFVQLADGREVLFIGDAVWKLRNIEVQRERPRWVTALLVREDRTAVFGQIKALGELMRREPDVKIVPGHDGPVVEKLAADGYLQPKFKL